MRCRRRPLGRSDDGFVMSCSYIEGFVEYERISQHISNIRAINFKGEPVPEGIKTYLAKQIEFIRGMVGRRLSTWLTASESSQGRGGVLEARWSDDDAAGGSGGWVTAVYWS